jgi:hypothetical protein
MVGTLLLPTRIQKAVFGKKVIFTLLVLSNGLQIGEGTNSVGIVRLDLGFCLCAVIASTFTNLKIGI